MATSLSQLPAPARNESLPSFSDWLQSKLNVVTLPVVIAFTSLLVNVVKTGQNIPPWFSSHAQAILHCLHALLIFILFLSVPHGFQTANLKYEKANKAATWFRAAWQLTLLAWLALYVSFITESFGVLPNGTLPAFHLGEDFLSCLSTIGFWFCFITVSNPDQRGDPMRWVGVVTCVLIMDLMGTILGLESVASAARIGVGALSGIAMAFFIGRLESRLLRPPRWLLGILYAYAILQFGYGYLESKSVLHQSIFYFMALAFKILLALFVNWLIGTGQLLFYLHYMSELNQDYSEKKETFLKEVSST